MRRPAEAIALTRLLSKAVRDPETDCWQWQGWVTPRGYGEIISHDKKIGVHRAMYELEHGSIGEGMEIDHLCRLRSCINPAHLEAVSRKENILRGVSPCARLARRTHCPQGHEYTPENTKIVQTRWGALRGTGRQCRMCHKLSNRRAYAANPDKILRQNRLSAAQRREGG